MGSWGKMGGIALAGPPGPGATLTAGRAPTVVAGAAEL
jgi:hypothetical protein